MFVRRRSGATAGAAAVDATVQLGPVTLANPIVAASGTFGHGDEFAALVDPAALGAVTSKSQACFAWSGNPAPRLHGAGLGMLNAVGLQGEGVAHWVEHDLPALRARGAWVIASIWGRSVADYAEAAAGLAPVAGQLAALEINLSCPNVTGHGIFAHDPVASAEIVAEVAAAGLTTPLFAKLSVDVADVVSIAGASLDAGATGLTLGNTVRGLGIDLRTRRPVLGAGSGGYSGPPIKPIALRAVYVVTQEFPGTPVIGTGGVSTGTDAAEMLLAGAHAVGVGTATFLDPNATLRIRDELLAWCAAEGVARVADLTGALAPARPAGPR